MSAMQTALIVIDAQQSFHHRPYFTTEGLDDYLAHQQALIDGARAAGMAVVQIFHVDGDDAFSLDSGFVRTIDGLSIVPDTVFHKHRHSAFVGTELDQWLKAHGITRLIISGIRTEQCCETTARHGSDIGYRVDYVTAATLTFPMTHASGRVFSADDIKARTELVLSGRFARITTVAEALAPAEANAA